MKYLLVGIVLILGATWNASTAQDTTSRPEAVAAEARSVTPNAADVASIDAITAAVYASISGDKGVERNWDRFRSLFHPSARLIPVRRTPNGMRGQAMTVEDFIANSNPFFVENGFYEKELSRKTEEFGSIAHHFSTYASYDSGTSTEPFARGINSFQLMHDGQRWWIVTIFWQSESAQNPIPDKYLNEMGQ